MSKNFKSEYTIDLANVESMKDFELAKIVGKLNASRLTCHEVSELVNNQVKAVIDENDADGIIIDKDGACVLFTYDEVVNEASDMIAGLITELQPEKKEPWYKRLWHKVFGKKNK